MATVVRGTKRPLDLDGMMDALPPSCGGAAHMTTPEVARIQKRLRYAEMMAASAAQAGVPFSVRENPFPIKPIEPKELESLVAKIISPRKSTVESEGEMRSPGPAVQTPRTSTAGGDKEAKGDKMYSHEELTSIVSKVVQQREAALREDYNNLLQAKLSEQFQSFTKFNEEYKSRQIKGSPFSYVS